MTPCLLSGMPGLRCPALFFFLEGRGCHSSPFYHLHIEGKQGRESYPAVGSMSSGEMGSNLGSVTSYQYELVGHISSPSLGFLG